MLSSYSLEDLCLYNNTIIYNFRLLYTDRKEYSEKHLKAHLLPDCPGFEHDGSADAHGEILIWGEQLIE